MFPLIRNLDGPIRANRFADSRELPDSRESFQGSQTEPLFCESRFGGLKTANHRFKAIRANRSHVLKTGVFLRIDSRESIHANRPGSRCESPGRLRLENCFILTTQHPPEELLLFVTQYFHLIHQKNDSKMPQRVLIVIAQRVQNTHHWICFWFKGCVFHLERVKARGSKRDMRQEHHQNSAF